MDEFDKIYSNGKSNDWAAPPDGILNVDFISHLANKMYREGISDMPADASHLPPDTRSASNDVHHVSNQVSEKKLPKTIPAITESNYYFLQHVPDQQQAAEKQAKQASEVFDLSGERCLLAPILPKVLPPEMAEQIITMVGKPADRIQMVQGFLNEFQARAPQVAPPFSDANLYFLENYKEEFSAKDFQQNNYADFYLQHYNAQPELTKQFYFLENQPTQKSKEDWSDYRMFHPETVRRDFPVLQQNIHGKPLVWLDNAATTQKPWAVINAVKEFYERDNSNIHRGAHTLAARATDAYEEAREKIRQFIGASSKDEIIFVRGTTEGINLIANTFGKQRIAPGDEILLSELEHHANIVPWQMLAQEKGARLRVIPINERGDIMLSEYERLFNPRTRLVAISQVSNALGTVVPVEEIIATAHRRGVPVVVDGAQSVQHMPVNVQELDADFFVFSGHKLFAPTGIGVVYGKMEHLEKMPPWQGGGNMINRVTFEETTYSGVPAKFEAGTPSIGDAIGLGAAIDYVRKIGLENIHRYETELMAYMVAALSDIPNLQIIGNPTHRAGALSFVMKNIPTIQMGQLLDQEGIAVRSGHHCAQPALRHFGQESSVRPSLAFYNITADIDRLREAILKVS